MPDFNDYPLQLGDLRQLENPKELINFFANLRYNTEDARQMNQAALGLETDEFRHEIRDIWYLAADPVEEDLKIYALELRAVNMKLIQGLTRRFRELGGNYLLVLSSDYENLSFVFLDASYNKSKAKGKAFTRVLHPRILKINRLNIATDSLEFRVLKRFSFTEEDAVAQIEKLRSAYLLAEWSEQYFNNRALFSDYYLNNRLTDENFTPEWREDASNILRKVVEKIRDARRAYSNQKEAYIRQELFEPLFTLLGFDYNISEASDSDTPQPDYKLYQKGQPEKPIALALTYVWNRNLDESDNQRDTETPDEIPGAQVVSILESTEVP